MSITFDKSKPISKKTAEALYDNNKNEVYFYSAAALCNRKLASVATVEVFKDSFRQLLAGRFADEDQFRHYLGMKTAEYCKAKLSKANPAVFKEKLNRAFVVSDNNKVNGFNNSADLFKALLAIPDDIRLYYILSGADLVQSEYVKKLFHLIDRTASDVDAVKATNISGLLITPDSNALKHFNAMLLSAKAEVSTDDDTDDAVYEFIGNNFSNNEEKKQLMIIGIVACVIILVGIIIVACVAGKWIKGNSADDSDSVDVSASDVVDQEKSDAEIYCESLELLDQNMTYFADIDIEGYGTITFEFNPEAAPYSCANFVKLAREGFYDGLTFHRIMEGFMMQGGNGGDTNEIIGEFSANGRENNLSHVRGTVSMARATPYDSGSSQFFIVHEDSTFLDGNYAAFGTVTEGMDIVDKICTEAQPTDNNGTIPSDEQPVINSVSIRTEPKS